MADEIIVMKEESEREHLAYTTVQHCIGMGKHQHYDVALSTFTNS